MATDDLFVDDFWYDDDGFVGYVEDTVDPGACRRKIVVLLFVSVLLIRSLMATPLTFDSGPWLNVGVAAFCVLSLLLLPFFVTLGRKYELRRIRQTEDEGEPVAEGAPLASREDKNINIERSEVSRAQSSYVHGRSVVSHGTDRTSTRRLQTFFDKIVMPPYPDDVNTHVQIPNRTEQHAQYARSEMAASRARSEAAAGFRFHHSETGFSTHTASSSLMVGSTTMLDTGGAYRNRRAGVRRYRRALKEKQWREEQSDERKAEKEDIGNIYGQLIHKGRGQKDHDVSTPSQIGDDGVSLSSFSVLSKLDNMALSPCDAVDANDNIPLLHERASMAGDESIDLCCGENALWRPSSIAGAFDSLLTIAEWDREMKRVIALAIPFSVSAVGEGVFDVVWVGLIANYIGTEAVAAYTIVDLILGLTEQFFGGLALTEASLCSQAVGCKNYKLAGQYVQISCIFYSLCMIPNILVWWFFTFDVVKLFRFDNDTASMAQGYARYYLFIQLIGGYDEAYGSLMEVTGHERWTTAIDILAQIVTTCVLVAFMLTQQITLLDVGTIQLAITVLFFGLNVIFSLWFGWMKKYTGGMFRSFALKVSHSHCFIVGCSHLFFFTGVLTLYCFLLVSQNRAAVKTVIKTAIPLAFGQLLQYGEVSPEC